MVNHYTNRLLYKYRFEQWDEDRTSSYKFTSKDQKLVKIIRHEHSECQLYVQRFDGNMCFVRIELSGAFPIYVYYYKVRV